MCIEGVDFETAKSVTFSEMLGPIAPDALIYFHQDDFEPQNGDFDFGIL